MRKTVIVFFILMTCYIANGQQDTILKDDDKLEVINKVAKIMEDTYVFSEMGKEMADFIKLQYKKGEYKSYNTISAFCRKLTSDLRSKCNNDKHLFVFYSPEEAYEVKAYHNLLPPDEIKKKNDLYKRYDKKQNYGFQKVEILEGNVGYLKLDYFSNLSAAETCAAAMKFLENTDAMIIDLRNNGGGEGIGSFLSSYFFDEDILFGYTKYRDSTLNEENWTFKYVPGKRLPNIPVYILINSKSFSAAEGFSYDLQQINRATIIGETSKGGAHPIDVLIVKDDILTQVPIAYSLSAITNSNWESRGVVPDVPVSSSLALLTAHELALKTLILKTNDQNTKDSLTEILKKIKIN